MQMRTRHLQHRYLNENIVLMPNCNVHTLYKPMRRESMQLIRILYKWIITTILKASFPNIDERFRVYPCSVILSLPLLRKVEDTNWLSTTLDR